MKQLREYQPITADQFPVQFMKDLGRVYENSPMWEETEELRVSYIVFADQLVQQYVYLLSLGYTFIFTEEDPYENFSQLYADYMAGQPIRIYSGGEAANGMMNRHITECGISLNLIFRAVHDIMGHCFNRNEFTPLGEENAVRSHACWFTEEAFLALMLETRGQNAWVAYGPHMAWKDVKPTDVPTDLNGEIVFADQKYFQLPKRFTQLNYGG